MPHVTEQELPLQRIWHWQQARADDIHLTQPLNGDVRNWTWAQAVDEARRMAAYLHAFGWPPGSHIALMSKNCAWWVLADYAIWMAGHVSVPVYPSLTGASVRQILEHSEARACFIGALDNAEAMESGIPDGVRAIRMPLAAPAAGLPAWEQIIADTAPLPGNPVRPAEALATIVYTSGTTGTPKGVMHRFATLALAPRIMARMFDGSADDRVLSHLPLAHVAERILIETYAIQTGCRIFFSEGLATFAQDLRRAHPTLFGTVPRLWTKFQQGVFAKLPQEQLATLLRDPQKAPAVKQQVLQQLGLDAVRYALVGAAPLPPEILQWYRDLGLELLELYGMSENFAISHCTRPGQVRVGYVGTPQEGVQVKFSEIGEVLVKSPCDMLGYYKEPGKTREAFTDDGYQRTGDVGVVDEAGRLRITGRAKEQFKTSKGKYVAPAPIENKLGACSKIEASCVTGASFPQPFAILMLPQDEWTRSQDPGSRAALTNALATHLESVNAMLDPHEQLDFVAVVPEQWSVDNGFITPTLKIKRAAIEQHYGPHFERWASLRQPVVWVQAPTSVSTPA
jgi:long-chain acyl-CoA synthetase